METFLILLIVGCLMLFVIPICMTSWKRFWQVSLLFALPLVLIWGQRYYYTSQPEYTGSPGEVIGVMFFMLLSISLALGMFGRFIRWIIEIKLQELRVQKQL
ncbi:hypothetical protein H0A36_22000 [Endozoicomonas sp. SM1973]|uniref:Uncharacterized protein n=1 Tax=Spartinivicinus marinus TaxID=2994442 RepID=A0A853IF75_9GAMM|nr:hypothetical protein [Spartinivicinus marinus]MCX4026160.1 hypothetical protein [Spartinivicinus marinus]NYZ68694.1 hypothetical protein [Spartinivicinus marinus]